MDNWRKNQRISNHNQVGQWRSSSSSYYGKPPLDNRFPTLPLWEKQFCASVGSVPWQKLIEGKRYMYMHPKVVNWDDSAVKEAFNNAKNRYWAEINGIPWDIPLPDPNIYIDDVDSNASVDHELYLDVVTEAEACHNIEEKGEAAVILGSSLLLNQSSSGLGLGPTGWGDKEDEKLTKPSEPNYAALGWESNQHENNETNIWEQYHSPVEHAAKEYGWQNGQNDSQGWNQRERYGGASHNKYQGRNSGRGNWGTWDGFNRKKEKNISWSKNPGRNSGRGNWGTWDGFNRKKEKNMSWSKNPGYHHGTNEYQMNIGGRRNGGRGGGGGRRGNFAVKEAFNNAKNRFWAEINDISCDIPLPDPNIYIDDVNWNASVDPKLYLDVEREAEARHNMEEKGEEVVILGSSLLLDQSFSGPGWGDEEDEKLTKPSEPNYAALGWESNQHKNNETNIWEQYHSPVEHAAKEYGWQNGQNDSQGWNQRERYGGDSHNKYQGRNSGRGNWGTWDGFNRKKENNMSWSKNPGYHHGTNEYKMIIGGRRNGGRGRGGGRRGNFAVKKAFNNAKNRFWAEINDIPCDIPLPDPNIYIDDVNWNASVDPELYLDVKREAEARHNMEEKGEEVVILGSSLLLDQSFSGPRWGDEEDEKLTKPYEPNYCALGWESNQHENNETNIWEQYHAPVEHAAKEYGWQNGQNDSQGWNQREQYGGDLHNKYQGKYSGNWGTWDGYSKKKENNISWLKNPGYHDGTNEYQMNSGRRRNGGRGGGGGGGRRGSFAYVDKVATPCAW